MNIELSHDDLKRIIRGIEDKMRGYNNPYYSLTSKERKDTDICTSKCTTVGDMVQCDFDFKKSEWEHYKTLLQKLLVIA